MKNPFNRTHIVGTFYEHKLEQKVSGENSKKPGTEYIAGELSIATDNAKTNIVVVHFSYTTALTSTGKPNATYNVLKSIIEGKVDKNTMIQVDSALSLNEFYGNSNGGGATSDELISKVRNEGGFVSIVKELPEDEKTRNTFRVDMLITGVVHVDADEERDIPEKALVKGCIFDFRKAILPIEFSVINPNAIGYFEDLGASSKNPVFTQVWGRQIAQNITVLQEEETAWGEIHVKEVSKSRNELVITGAIKTPYVWDDESTILASELTEAIAARNTYLASLKDRQDAYKASRGAAPQIAATSEENFDF